MLAEEKAIPAGDGRSALVLGVNGQDGSYLAERLLAGGWRVLGVGRQHESRWLGAAADFSYHALDLSDVSGFSAFLHAEKPEVVFHVAAVHGAAGFVYEDHWQEVHAVNTVCTHAILEYLRRAAPGGVLVYASSSKVFGPALPNLVNETSPRHSGCIYTITKNSSTDLIAYYRKVHGVKASVVWTFNHESPRRAGTFFIPQVVEVLARSIIDGDYQGEIGSLGFWCDWGDAAEFMEIFARIAVRAPGSDLLLATGDTLWAEDFADTLFGGYGLSRKKHLRERMAPPAERPPKWQADLSALSAGIGGRPVRTVYDVADDILRLNHPAAWERVRAGR
jgi:GDPmannose 4,6-dehydratase